MLAPFYDEHWLDDNGNPAGGVSTGTGVCISWQNGTLGRGPERREPNGAFVETVLEMLSNRLGFYQTAAGGRFACPENEEAIVHIQAALAALERRTWEREARQVEGLHQP